MNLLFNDFKI